MTTTPLYYANPIGRLGSELHARIEEVMMTGQLAYIDTPDQHNTRFPGVHWCADNGCFGAHFSYDKWFRWLTAQAPDAGNCQFATAPDVVGDAEATLLRSTPWLGKIRALGFPVAYVAQDGFDPDVIPWDDIDVIFIGGTDDYKIGGRANVHMDGTVTVPAPSELAIRSAQEHGKKVHVGRVNSRKRFRYFTSLGVDTMDGTYLLHGHPLGANLDYLLSWRHEALDTEAAALTAAA
jgi:hypothetical protein